MEKKLFRHINGGDLNSYEKESGYLSYRNLFYKDDSLILCNNIAEDYGTDLELIYGNDYDEENDQYTDIYQYYIIDGDTAERLGEVGELIFYHNRLDIYILGVAHFGTSWDYVLTDIKLEKDDDNGDWYSCFYETEEDEEGGNDEK